jgi:hypothetical protein
MSVFSSLCFDHYQDDPIDVAYSVVEPEVRLWVKCDEDGSETTTYLTVEQAKHLVELINTAIRKTL